MYQRLFPILVLCASLFAIGCGDAAPERPMCDQIMDACHAVDPGTGPLHDCHQTAETATEAMCVTTSTNCLAICGAAAMDSGTADLGTSDDAGPADDAGPVDAGSAHMH